MRTCLYIALVVFVTDFVQAQDTLYKADGSMHLAKILEVNDTQVKYKLTANPEGPTYVIGKENVLRIIYASGFTEVFPTSTGDIVHLVKKIDSRSTDFGRNFISVNILDMLTKTTLSVGYEYTFKSGLSSIKVPVSFGLNNNAYYYEYKTFGTGLDFNLYPYGQGRAKFFYGPSFEYKKFRTTNFMTEVNSAYTFLLQAGFLFQPEKHLNISVVAGIGYMHLFWNAPDPYSNKGDVATRLGLNAGYKF